VIFCRCRFSAAGFAPHFQICRPLRFCPSPAVCPIFFTPLLSYLSHFDSGHFDFTFDRSSSSTDFLRQCAARMAAERFDIVLPASRCLFAHAASFSLAVVQRILFMFSLRPQVFFLRPPRPPDSRQRRGQAPASLSPAMKVRRGGCLPSLRLCQPPRREPAEAAFPSAARFRLPLLSFFWPADFHVLLSPPVFSAFAFSVAFRFFRDISSFTKAIVS